MTPRISMRTAAARIRSAFPLAALALVLAGAAGCTAGPAEPDGALVQAERQWRAGVGASAGYVLRQQRRCYCLSLDTMRVTVSAGRITAVVNERTGVAAPEAEYAWYRTVSQLFDAIRTVPARGGRILEVRYHPTLGYPTLLSTDPIPAAADDEVAWVTVLVEGGP